MRSSAFVAVTDRPEPGFAAPTAARESPLERWSPLGGILFVVGMIVVLVGVSGDTGDTAASVVEYAEDESGWIDFWQFFALLSLLLLGWFVGGLYSRLRRREAHTESALALIGGVGFSVLLFVAFTIWNAPLMELDDEVNDIQTTQAETYLAIEDVGWVTLGGAGVAAGLMIIAASVAALRGRWLPAWAGWVGVALGAVALATVAFVGIFAWLAWIVIASVLMLVRSMRAPAAAPR
jgi:hypothetical protein